MHGKTQRAPWDTLSFYSTRARCRSRCWAEKFNLGLFSDFMMMLLMLMHALMCSLSHASRQFRPRDFEILSFIVRSLRAHRVMI